MLSARRAAKLSEQALVINIVALTLNKVYLDLRDTVGLQTPGKADQNAILRSHDGRPAMRTSVMRRHSTIASSELKRRHPV